jgi:hypothetical protein
MSWQKDSTGQLERLVAQFFQLVAPQDLYNSFPPSDILKDPNVQNILYRQMFDESSVVPIPPVGYRVRVLKEILSRIEEAFSDPEQDV